MGYTLHMQSTALLDRLGLDNLKNPEFVARIHSSIAEYQRRFSATSANVAKQGKTFEFYTVNDAKFEGIYACLANSLLDSPEDPSQNVTLCEKSIQLLKWSQINSNWNAIFAAKISDLDPSKFTNIINESKFDILASLHFPYSIALNLLINESLVAECIAEPILASFRYNFESSMSKLSRFSKIENSFLFIKLQFDLCMIALGKSWVTLEENRQLLINNLKVPNASTLIAKLLDYKPIESVGLVLAKYFKNFILTRLSYFAYEYIDSYDTVLSVSQLANISRFDDVVQTGIAKTPENSKVSRVLIGGLFNLASKWDEIDHQGALELLKDEAIPTLCENTGFTINVISYWQTLQSQVIDDFVPEIFGIGLVEALKDMLISSVKYCELLEQPELYVEATIGSFINKTLEMVKVGWNEILNILDSIQESSKYLKIISDIAITCETSEIKPLIQLESVYSMREKMHKIFILCIDEDLQAEVKYMQKKVLNFDILEERINVLGRYTPSQSFNEIFVKVASNIESVVLDYIIPNDNLMTIKNEASLELLYENLHQLALAMPVPMPRITELLYIFKNAEQEIDVDSFAALSAAQAEQAICQALHAKLDFQEFALLTKRSN